MPSYSTIDDVRRSIDTYQETFRNPQLPRLKLSGLYDLFPHEGVVVSKWRWPEPWPGGDRAGVYVVFAEDKSVVYVGKASMNSAIGVRLCSYFVFDEKRNCRIRHPKSWEGKPKFVATVAMDHEYRFEAPALEEFLIAALETTDNKAGSGANDI